MSNFGLFFYFCSDLPNFWHVSYKLIGKHFCVFFPWFSLHFREIFAVLLFREKQKKPFVSLKTKHISAVLPARD